MTKHTWRHQHWHAIFAYIIAFFALISTSHAANFPYAFTDDLGHKVTLAKQPKRIISIAPSITEILFALGLGDRVIAVDTDSDYPAAVASKERIGSGLAPSIERIVALQPDLILLWDASAQDLQQKLSRFGIATVVFTTQSLADAYSDIIKIGRLTGADAAAAAVVEGMKKQVATIASTVRKSASKPVVLYEVWPDPLYTVGPGSLMHELIELAGGRNLADDAKSAWPVYSAEVAIARNPDVILTTFAKDQSVVNQSNKASWAQVKAVRTGRIYQVDQNLVSRPGPRLTEGLLAIAKAIHPELF